MTDADDELMARLRELGARVDPVPADVVMAGRSALAYRDLDLRLAALVEDAALAGVRGDDDGWFTFEVDDVVIEVAVQERADALHLVGQVDAPPLAELAVRQGDRDTSIEVDDLGRFTCPIDPGPVRVALTLVDGPRIATSWIVAARR